MLGIITWENGNLNFSGNWENWVIPGKGEKGKKCGEPVPVLSCQVCLKAHWVKHKCGQSSCPNCWKDWLTESVGFIKTRLESKILQKRNRWGSLRHIVLSPSKELHHLPKAELEKKAIKYLEEKLYIYLFPKKEKKRIERKLIELGGKYIGKGKHKAIAFPYWKWVKLGNHNGFKEEVKKYYQVKMGVFGGCLIWHPFRVTKEGKRKAMKEGKHFWEWIREQENWQDYVYFSPHFHFIGYCGFLEEPFPGEEFVYKTITFEPDEEEKEETEKKKNGINWDAVGRCLHYLLTHAGIDHYKHAYDWIGNARGIFSLEEELVKTFRFRYENGKIVYEISKKELKKKENYCRFCWKHFQQKRNSLWYFYENLRSALWYWLGLDWESFLQDKTKALEILKAKEGKLPWYIYRNLEENILAMSGIPPDDLEDYLIF